jgi:DNA polymerase-3 subunit beta
MYIKVAQKHLSQRLKLMSGAIGNKVIDALTYVKFVASEDGTKVCGTDLTVAVSLPVPCYAHAFGEACIPYKKLAEIVSVLHDDIHIEVDNNNATITCGKSKIRLACLPVDNYPPPPFSGEKFLELKADALLSHLGNVSYACASKDDDIRYSLESVCMEISDNTLYFVATDSHRLAVKSMPLEAENARMLIPAKAVILIGKMFTDGDITLSKTESTITFRQGGTAITAVLLEGSFPQWRGIMTGERGNKLTIEKEILVSALSRALVMGEQGYVTIKLKDGVIDISAFTKDLGDSTESISCEYVGDDLTISLDARYLIEAVAPIKGDYATIHFGEAMSAFLTKDGSYTAVMMPIRI